MIYSLTLYPFKDIRRINLVNSEFGIFDSELPTRFRSFMTIKSSQIGFLCSIMQSTVRNCDFGSQSLAIEGSPNADRREFTSDK